MNAVEPSARPRRASAAVFALLAGLLVGAPASDAQASSPKPGAGRRQPKRRRPVRRARAWLGVELTRASEREVRVKGVFDGSPAAKAGLLEGDRLLRADGDALTSSRQLVNLVRASRPGDALLLDVARGGRKLKVRVRLLAHPGRRALQRDAHLGKAAPALVGLTSLDKRPAPTLSKLRGKVVLLDFWASWCGNCRRMVPVLADLHRDLSPKGAVILGVTSDSLKTARAAKRAWQMPYRVLSDARGRTNGAYRVSAIPALYLIDKKGVIRDVVIGYDPSGRAELERKVRQLLAEK